MAAMQKWGTGAKQIHRQMQACSSIVMFRVKPTKVLKGGRLFVGTLLGEDVREVASRKDGHMKPFHQVWGA